MIGVSTIKNNYLNFRPLNSCIALAIKGGLRGLKSWNKNFKINIFFYRKVGYLEK